MDYIKSQSAAHPEQAAQFDELGQLHEKKLWHQLTLKLLEFARLPFFQTSPNLLHLHQNFIHRSIKKINPLEFVQLSISASKQIKDKNESIKFLTNLLNELEKDNSDAQQAKVLMELEITRKQMSNGQIEEVKQKLDESKSSIDSYSGVMDSSIYSHYYLTSLEYHKIKGPPSDYFTNSLLYLTYTPLDRLDIKEQVTLASDIGMSALLGNTIYNFGELLQHQIIKVLDGTEYAWLANMLNAFNAGDIKTFHTLFATVKSKQPLLAIQADFLLQKIRIMALMEYIFQKPSNERSLTFDEIAKVTEVKEKEVEWLVMKALSLKVIKGSVNEVEKVVRVKWVQPRVLDTVQLKSLANRLQQWTGRVEEATRYIQDNAAGIVASAQLGVTE